MTNSESTTTYGHLGVKEITAPTLADTVADALRESIYSGKFAPGERVFEAALAREFGISRGPIREALALLEGDGLVENVPRRGKFVTGLDLRAIEEIYGLRQVLEPYAGEIVIETLDEESETALRESLEDLRRAVESGDRAEIANCDIAFHACVYYLADHKLLKRTWDDIIASKLRMLVNITTRTHEITDPQENHEQIVDAILSRQADKARRLIVEHIEDAKQRARSALDESLAATDSD